MAKALLDIFEKDYLQITRRIFEFEPEPSSPVYNNKVPKHVSSQRAKQRAAKGKAAKNAKNAKRKRPAAAHREADGNKLKEMVNTMLMLQNKVKMMEEKLRGIRNEDEPEPENDRPMTVEEKKILSQDINKMSGENLQKIVSIIEASQPLDRQSSEIEIDLDTLSNETLRKLQECVHQCELNRSLSSSKSRNPGSLIDRADPYETFNSDSGWR